MRNKRANTWTPQRCTALAVALIFAGGWLGHAAGPAVAVVPGANSLITFASNRDGDSEIYTITPKGEVGTTGQPAKQLTHNRALDDDPAWSPNGKRVAFTSNRDGDFEIFVMAADGGGQANLTNNTARDDQATWSPDGKRIAFVSVRDGNAEIYVMDANGDDQTNLTQHPNGDLDPA